MFKIQAYILLANEKKNYLQTSEKTNEIVQKQEETKKNISATPEDQGKYLRFLIRKCCIHKQKESSKSIYTVYFGISSV